MTPSQQAPSLVEPLNELSAWLSEHNIDMQMPVGMIDPAEAAARITELEQKLQATDAAWDDDIRLLTASTARAERAEADVAALTKALTGLTCGGSEFFIRRGDGFVADVDACVAWVRRSKEDAHRRTVEAFKARRRAEAQCRVLQEAMRKIATDPYQHGQRVQRMKMIAAQALSLSGGGGREEKGSARADLSPASRSPEPSDLEDEIADALQDSLGPDWTCRDGAKAVVRLLEETRR